MTPARENGGRTTVVASLMVFAVAILLLWGRTVPVVSADEIGYLANAELLVRGTLLNMGFTRFYSGGYSLLLVPINLLFEDPRSFYQAGVLLNAMLLAGTVPVLVRLAHDFGFARTALTPWLAAVLTFWPSQLFQAFLSLPEIGLRLIVLLLVVAVFAMFRAGGLRHGVLVVLLALLAYSFHARALVLLPLTLLLLIATVAGRRSNAGLGIGVGAVIMVVGFLGIGRLNAFLQSKLWLHQSTSLGDVVTLARRVLEHPLQMAERSFGHGWYQMIATLLLVPFGAIVLGTWALRGDRSDRRAVAIFVLLATVGIGAAGSSNMIWPETIDWLIYSRFLDVITPVLAWIGILSITRQEWRPTFRRWLPWLGTGVVAGGVLLYLRYAGDDLGGPLSVEIGSLAPLVGIEWLGPDPLARTMVSAPLILLVLAVGVYFSARREAALLGVLSLFCLLSGVAVHRYYRAANAQGEIRTAAAARAFDRLGNATIHQDRSARGGQPYIQQFMLGRYFPPLDVSRASPPGGTVALIGRRAMASLRGDCLALLPVDLALVRIGGPDVVACAAPLP